MKVKLITALTSHQVEDQVIEVLLKHDFELYRRLLTSVLLEEELLRVDTTSRILVITDLEFGANYRKFISAGDENLAVLLLDVSKRFSSEEILLRANDALRGTNLGDATSIKFLKEKAWILFTGANGSPGISTLALNTSQEFSKLSPAALIDADLNHQSLSQMVGEQSSKQRSLLKADLSLQSITSLEEIDIRDGESAFLDIGSAPLLSEAISDRRIKGRLFMEALNRCSSLIYIIHQDRYSLNQLEQFEELRKKFSIGSEVIYLLNKESANTSKSAFRKSFRSKIATQPHFFLPYEYANLERARTRYSTLAEVSSRSSLARALRDLAVYLHKKI